MSMGELKMDITKRELETMKRNVRRGACFLKEQLGDDWYVKVDKDKLRMQSAESCVLGQLFRNYFAILEELFPKYSHKKRHKWAESHGFATDNVWWGILGDLWRDRFKREARAKQLELPRESSYTRLKDKPDGLYRFANTVSVPEFDRKRFLVVKLGDKFCELNADSREWYDVDMLYSEYEKV